VLKFGRSFEYLHETARHFIHSSEMLVTAISVTEAVIKEVCIFAEHEYEHDLACVKVLTDLEIFMLSLTRFSNRV
jgi:hypothetical protein